MFKNEMVGAACSVALEGVGGYGLTYSLVRLGSRLTISI